MNILLITLILASFSINKNAMAESKLLREVKRNPDEAKSLCQNFRALNKRNISARSQESIQKISTQKNLSKVDAQILSMYVRAFHCPETF